MAPHWTHLELSPPNSSFARTDITALFTKGIRAEAAPPSALGTQAGLIANRRAFVPRAGVALLQAKRESDTECGIIVIVAGGKTLQKMRKNRMGWRIEELEAVAEENFVEWRRPGRGGSHVIFSAAGVREIVSVPAKRPIKPVYIKQFVALIDAAGGIRTK